MNPAQKTLPTAPGQSYCRIHISTRRYSRVLWGDEDCNGRVSTETVTNSAVIGKLRNDIELVRICVGDRIVIVRAHCDMPVQHSGLYENERAVTRQRD